MKVRCRHKPKTAGPALAAELANAEFILKEDLVAARKEAGLEQQDVATKLGVEESAVAQFERLDSNPTLSMIRYYAHAIGALVSYRVELVLPSKSGGKGAWNATWSDADVTVLTYTESSSGEVFSSARASAPPARSISTAGTKLVVMKAELVSA